MSKIDDICNFKKFHDKSWLIMDTKNHVVLTTGKLWRLNKNGRIIASWDLTYDEGTALIATNTVDEFYPL